MEFLRNSVVIGRHETPHCGIEFFRTFHIGQVGGVQFDHRGPADLLAEPTALFGRRGLVLPAGDDQCRTRDLPCQRPEIRIPQRGTTPA